MSWLIAILVAAVTGLSGLEPLGALLLGGLSWLLVDRLERAERRIGQLESANASRPLDELFAAESHAPASSDSTREPEVPRPPLTQPGIPAASSPWAAMAPPPPATPKAAPGAADLEPAWSMPSLADLERLFAGRVLAVVGGLALIVGVVFFLGLAFSRGWIGPELRVVIGLVAGAVAFAVGSVLVGGRQAVVGHVLLAVGLGAVNVALFAATRLYEFVPPEIGLLGALITAAAAVVVALGRPSQVIAAYGLVAVLAAPPVMGASATLTTVAFLGVALVGTTSLAIARDWRWLPPAGFALTAPQLALYLDDRPPPAIALTALSAFWVLHALAAGGEELRRRLAEPSPTSATVLLASAGLLMWGGFEVLDGDLERWRGLFLVAVAGIHLGLGGLFLAREHDRHAFSLMALGTGIAAVTMAAPIQLGGPPVPIVWAAEAAALAWVAAQRRHPYSAGAAIMLGALAIGHLVAIEYPIDGLGSAGSAIPFVSGRGAAFGFVIAAMAVAGWLGRDRTARLVLGGIGVLLLAYVIPFELTDPLARMSAWGGVAGATTVVMRRFLGVPLLGSAASSLSGRDGADRAPYVAAAFAGCLAAGALLIELLPITELPMRLAAVESFGDIGDAGTLAGLMASAAILAVALAVSDDEWRRVGIVAAVGVAAYAVPFDLPAGWTVIGWTVLGVAVVGARALDANDSYSVTGVVLATTATLMILAVVMPPDRLVVDAHPSDVVPLLNVGSLGVVAVGALLGFVWWQQDPARRAASAGLAAAALLVVYGLSVGVVDLFGSRVGEGIALEELQEQAQTALSVLLAALGGIGLAAGLRLRLLEVRLFGLGLLTLATGKVFLVDLATLDVAYRVLSFVGLGLLLLGSAWVFFRLQSVDETGTG